MIRKGGMGSDAAECTRACAAKGVPYGFVDARSGRFYQLDDGAQAAGLAGERVVLRGREDGDSILVETIRTEDAPGPSAARRRRPAPSPYVTSRPNRRFASESRSSSPWLRSSSSDSRNGSKPYTTIPIARNVVASVVDVSGGVRIGTPGSNRSRACSMAWKRRRVDRRGGGARLLDHLDRDRCIGEDPGDLRAKRVGIVAGKQPAVERRRGPARDDVDLVAPGEPGHRDRRPQVGRVAPDPRGGARAVSRIRERRLRIGERRGPGLRIPCARAGGNRRRRTESGGPAAPSRGAAERAHELRDGAVRLRDRRVPRLSGRLETQPAGPTSP